MKTLFLSLLFALPHAQASTQAQDHYEYLKGTEYKVDYSHRYGSGLQRLVLEKSSRNEICQKVANGRPWTDFEFNCYVVSDVGTTARGVYETAEAVEELDVRFVSTNGTRILLGAQINEKQSSKGFCRKVSNGNTNQDQFLCYKLTK